LLPLIPLTYDNLASNDDFDFQLSSDILFQAITRRSADENVDMENLEILGDCFLKLTVSMCLYHRYPLAGAGALTIEKGKQISNGNLYRIAVLKRLKSYLNAMKINIRGEDANWIPPGYLITNESELKRYKTQKVKRKAFADMIEAFIGAFLISTNYSTTIQFMKWLGLDVIPEDTKIPSIVCSSIGDGEVDSVVNRFYKEQDFSMIEKTIHHEFKNKAYLIAAFTHPSSFANRLTNCYERYFIALKSI
jgi:endoribonuclease Dicer